MRVNAPTQPFGIAPAKSKKIGDDDSDFSLPEEAAQAEAKSGAKPASASSMSALIAAQLHGVEEEELEQRRRRKRKAVERGRSILTTLDQIKLDMLTGNLDQTHVQRLLVSLEVRDGDYQDEKLKSILDEIELRARVELAKLQKKEQSG